MSRRVCAKYIMCCLVSWMVFGGMMVASAEPYNSAEALLKLLSGNVRFHSGQSTHLNISAQRRIQVATDGQHPFATIIACSDSRVPVEILFDQGVGDIFVIKVAGNVCNTDEIGSIEYGVDHLGTPIMVVLGHTHCGACTAVATGAEVHGSIPDLIAPIKPAFDKVQAAYPHLNDKALVPALVEENVWQAIEDLLVKSSSTRERAKDKRVIVVGAVYNIESGTIKWMGTHPEQGSFFSNVEKGVWEK
ncbi:MAG: carbonic anhydrase [Planctomycetes bacterium]|nr:carbonic anhydrase [Planctomycetota bacterium]